MEWFNVSSGLLVVISGTRTKPKSKNSGRVIRRAMARTTGEATAARRSNTTSTPLIRGSATTEPASSALGLQIAVGCLIGGLVIVAIIVAVIVGVKRRNATKKTDQETTTTKTKKSVSTYIELEDALSSDSGMSPDDPKKITDAGPKAPPPLKTGGKKVPVSGTKNAFPSKDPKKGVAGSKMPSKSVGEKKGAKLSTGKCDLKICSPAGKLSQTAKTGGKLPSKQSALKSGGKKSSVTKTSKKDAKKLSMLKSGGKKSSAAKSGRKKPSKASGPKNKGKKP